MTRRVAILVMAFSLAWPLPASGQETRSAASAAVHPLTVDGAPGVWFPLEEARAATAALREAQGYRERLHLMEGQLELAEAELADIHHALELADAAERSAEESLAQARLALTEAQAHDLAARQERDTWEAVALGAGGVAIVLGVILGLAVGVH